MLPENGQQRPTTPPPARHQHEQEPLKQNSGHIKAHAVRVTPPALKRSAEILWPNVQPPNTASTKIMCIALATRG
jgi:hypothetical protein